MPKQQLMNHLIAFAEREGLRYTIVKDLQRHTHPVFSIFSPGKKWVLVIRFVFNVFNGFDGVLIQVSSALIDRGRRPSLLQKIRRFLTLKP
jgi:hypothetical protein